MPNRFLPLFILFIFLANWHFVYADLVINEVMYDLSGADSTNSKSREWVEVYNNGSSDINIDASIYRIYDGGANRTINGENNFTIPALSYVVWAGDKDTFLVDHPGFSGTVYDTGITTLSNTGANLKIIRTDTVDPIDSFVYTSSMGANGDDNTIQKISNTWTSASPTPGVTNESSSSSSSTTNTSNSSNNISIPETENTPTSIASDIFNQSSGDTKKQKIKTEIVVKNTVFTGVSLKFSAYTLGYYGEVLPYGRYFWNFGDGDAREMKVNEVENFTHTYFYPGDYVVSLEYYMSYYGDVPEAIDKMIIKVIDPNLVISNVGDEKDFFIEITNNGNTDADISKWILASQNSSFILPKNTIIEPRKKLILSGYITHFTFGDKETLQLLNSQRNLIYEYKKIEENKINNIVNTAPKINTKIQEYVVPDNVSDEIVVKENLEANAISSVSDLDNSFVPIAAFVLFLGTAGGAVYFLRRNKINMDNREDFELLDE